MPIFFDRLQKSHDETGLLQCWLMMQPDKKGLNGAVRIILPVCLESYPQSYPLLPLQQVDNMTQQRLNVAKKFILVTLIPVGPHVSV
jgi:hypothetical protein